MNFPNVLFSFSGRINRAKYWLAAVFWLVMLLIAFIVILVLVGRGISDFSGDDVDWGSVIATFGTGIIILLIVFIPMFISYLAIGIKRLHDRNKSGWWIVLFYFGPLLLDAIGNSIDEGGAVSLVLALAGFAIAIWGLVELGFLKGTTGPNQYGPDPLTPPHGAAPV